MATIAKNFRVKNGLVVEGTTATVNGNNILTAANTTDDVTEGSSNLYFSDERVQDAVNALVSNGTHNNITVTYDDENNSLSFAADASLIPDTDALSEGTTNLYYTDERVQDAVNALIAGGTHENIQITYDDASNTLSFVAENGVADSDTDDLAEGATNLYFTDARALDAVQSSYEAYADQAETDAVNTANTYTDNLIGDGTVDGTTGNTVKDRIDSAVANLVGGAPELLDTLDEIAAAIADDENFSTTVVSDIAQGLTDAKAYTDTRETAITTAYQSYADTAEADAISTAAADATTKADAALASAQTYADTAEADAIAAANTYTDDAITAADTDDIQEGTGNLYFTDERAQDAVASAIAAGTHENITITYDDAGNALSFVAENGVADSTTDDLDEGSSNLYFTDQRAVDALQAVTPTFTEVDVNSVALNVASTVSVATQNTTGTVYSFDSGAYTSAKFVVKADTGTHTEVTEVLLTLDSSSNIAITEYAIVNTGGSLIDVTAVMNGTDVELQATVVNDNTTVSATGTLIA